MASWLGSLDSVVRLQNIAFVLTLVGALTAGLSGVATYWLSHRAAALRDELGGREIETVQRQAQRALDSRVAELEESRRLLEASEARANALSERVLSLEEELAQRASPPARQSGPSRPKAARGATASPASTPDQRLAGALAGKPTGAITLVAVSSQPESLTLARRLSSVLQEAGWTTEVIEAIFPTPPDGLIFVVHGRDSIPDRQHTLALALAEAGWLTPPAKITANPSRPAGYLGLVVGTGNQ